MNDIKEAKKGRHPIFKCIYCGQYISYEDILLGNVKNNFIPDSHFTIEQYEFWHKGCEV